MRALVLGSVIALVNCGPSNRHGDDDVGPDGTPAECTDGDHQCNSSVYQVCSGGHWATQEECAATCADNLGCVACNPGTNICQDGNVHSCDGTGQVGGETMACTGSNICNGGACVDACADAAMHRSYTGCEYWAVDLDNAVEVLGVQGDLNCSAPGAQNVNMQVCANSGNTAVAGLCDPPGNSCPSGFTCKAAPVCILDAQHSPFAIVVSNPQSRSVNVTVTPPTGAPIMQTVAAGQVVAIKPQPTVADQSEDGSGKQKIAYKITSDLPIVAYQFNPLDNVNVFSNDASLLIPRTAFDVEYYSFSWPTENRRNPPPGQPSNHDYHGYVSVVAWQDNTVIEITPTAATIASATQPAIAANTPTQFTLNAHEVLTLQAVADADLTGTKIKSVDGVQTFGVFGGHEAMGFGEMTPPDQTHSNGPCCADHIEEMMFPTSTWGKTFAITRSQPRGTNEPDVIRVMAQKANTMVTFTPAPASGTCPMLQPGKFCEVKIQGDTAITATEPVLVGHYTESAIWQDPFLGGVIGTGDPDLAIAVPTEQYRKDYTVLVPMAYAKNYMSISAPAAGLVQVDGLSIQMTPFANGEYRGARHQVVPGQHKISCPNGCGVEIYGYGDAVSYMFAGGLDLAQIVIN